MSRDNTGMVSFATDYVTTAAVNATINRATRAALSAILSPAQLLLDVAFAGATSAATYLILGALKLSFNGTIYTVKTTTGCVYAFFQPTSNVPLIKERPYAYDPNEYDLIMDLGLSNDTASTTLEMTRLSPEEIVGLAKR